MKPTLGIVVTACMLVAGGCVDPPWPEDHLTTMGNWQAVAAGGSHSCGIQEDGSIHCWGCGNGSDHGQCDPPTTSEWTSIVASEQHACAYGGQPGIECWGDSLVVGGVSELPDVVRSATWKELSTDHVQACGILADNDEIWCWGEPSAPMMQGVNVQQIQQDWTDVTVGREHLCGLEPGGAASCQGDDDAGQISAPGIDFEDISAGAYHTCGIDEAGMVHCWGCGEGDQGQCDVPDAVVEGVESWDYEYVEVHAGVDFTCAREQGDCIECWGCGDGDEGPCDPYAHSIASHLASISVGVDHACAVTQKAYIYCWGDDSFGQRDPP
jgi:alpha-tubulin suppressor-like RCC1 family protein